MAAAFISAGTNATGTTTVNVPYPSSIKSGDLLLLFIAVKGPSSDATAPGAFTFLGKSDNTSGTVAANTGPTSVYVFYKIADGTETGSASCTTPGGDRCDGRMALYGKNNFATWDIGTEVTDGTQDATSTTITINGAAGIDLSAGDLIIGAVSLARGNSSGSGPGFSGSGMTFGTAAERIDNVNSSSPGVGLYVADAYATTGNDNAPTFTFTYGSGGSGSNAGVLFRVREIPAVDSLHFTANCQDNAASTVVDGDPVDGTLVGAGDTSASSVSGPGGSFPLALSFDGTDDYADFGDYRGFGNEVTFLCWVYRSVAPTSLDGIFTMRGTGAQLAGIIFKGSSRLGYQFSNNSSTYGFNGPTTPANTWFLAAVAISPTDAKLYVIDSGGTTTSTNSVANAVTDYGRNVRIAVDSVGSRESQILVAGARIYTETLSQSAIEAIYSADLAGGGGTTVDLSGSPATATASVVDPTVQIGGLIITPAAAAATASAVDPTAVLGSLTIAASFANATAGAVGPTVTLGSVTVAAGLADALAAAVGPAVSLGAIAVAAGVADATASAVAPSAVLGSVVIASGVASATASAVAPSISIGSGEPVAVPYVIGFALEFVVSISVDEGTGGRWEIGLAVPALSRSLAASPQTREIAAVERIEAAAAGELNRGVSAPDLNRTDAEG